MVFFVHIACMLSLSKICPERSKILSNFFQRIFLNEYDWQLPLFRLELSLNFVLLVIFVTENQSTMNFLHLSRTAFYTHYLSCWWHGLQKREFYQVFFSLFLILIHCWIDIRFLEFYIQQFYAFLENRLIISWLAFAWSLKHLLLSDFTFLNQASASSSKSPSWKSNKTRNIQNKIKCLFQLLC